jgi:hypothetical protein
MSLRRLFLKPDGMGSSGDYWKEACFTAVSFGDGLGESSSQLAISDCADRFMGVNTRRYLTQSIYMDDIMSFFFEMEKIQFHRKAVFSEAASIKFKIYCGSKKYFSQWIRDIQVAMQQESISWR